MQSGRSVAILSERQHPVGPRSRRVAGDSSCLFRAARQSDQVQALLAELGLTSEQAAFVGDEVADLPLLQLVGFAATVPDAVSEVRRAIHYVTRKNYRRRWCGARDL